LKNTDKALEPVRLDGTWSKLDGNWKQSRTAPKVTCGGYLQDADRSRDALYLSAVEIRDGVVEAEVSVPDVVPHGTNAHLVFRFQDPQNYLFAGLGGWEFQCVIAEMRPGEGTLGKAGWQTLATKGRIQDIEARRWYQVRVEFLGPDVELLVDGTSVLRHHLSGPRYLWPAGRVGLRGFGLWRAGFRGVRAWKFVPRNDVGPRLHQLDLSVIRDARLRAVSQKDLDELRSMDSRAAPKACVTLCGSIAEAALLDYLTRNLAAARAAAAGLPKPITLPIKRWAFDTMIEIAMSIGAIGKQTYATSHVLREWRNWIHPGRAEAQRLEPTPLQAVAASECVLALFADLK
jgi:hypothetical protein